jgi:hypothetical protein
MVLDIMHGLYAMVWGETKEMEDFKIHYSDYKSKHVWEKMIKDVGFLHEKQSRVNENSWRFYYHVFRKLQKRKREEEKDEQGKTKEIKINNDDKSVGNQTKT